jgi:hypothetical protein
MKTFEDFARDRILLSTLLEVESAAVDAVSRGVDPSELGVDRHDAEVFAGMIYAILRAGARREGQEGFSKAFEHFTEGRWSYSSDEELDLIRGALLASVDRFSAEAAALRVYFDALELRGMSEEDATRMAMMQLTEPDSE